MLPKRDFSLLPMAHLRTPDIDHKTKILNWTSKTLNLRCYICLCTLFL